MNIKLDFNNIKVKESKKDFTVKILMLKGEKGDTGSPEWGAISGDITSQTDLKNALDLKANTSDIPTKVSNLTNDSGFITKVVNDLTNYYLKSETYTKTEVNNLIGQITSFSVEVVQSLPTTDISPSTIYFVPKTGGASGDVYNEYLYISNSWELIGTTQIDLSNYYTKTQIDTSQTNQDNKINKKPYYFNTVAEMKAYNLSAGDMAITKGYYSANDGGGAEYNIVSSTSNYSETLNNNLKAELIVNNHINIKQLGAYGDGTHDDTSIFTSAITELKNKYNDNGGFTNLTLIIPSGKYKITEKLSVPVYISLNVIGNAILYSFVDDDATLWLNSDNKNISTSSNEIGLGFNLNKKLIGGDGSLTIEKNDTDDVNDLQATSIGLMIGDLTYNANYMKVARFTIENVNILGFNTAIKLNDQNTYLITFKSVRCELNNKSFVYGTIGTNYNNSGENISFYKCVFATSYNAIVNNTKNGDGSLNFNQCSFDFNGNVMLLNNGLHAILNSCHFEGIGFNNSQMLSTKTNTTGFGSLVYNNYIPSGSDGLVHNSIIEINNPNLYLASSHIDKLFRSIDDTSNYPLLIKFDTKQLLTYSDYNFNNTLLNDENCIVKDFDTRLKKSVTTSMVYNRNDNIGTLSIIPDNSSISTLDSFGISIDTSVDDFSINLLTKLFNKSLKFSITSKDILKFERKVENFNRNRIFTTFFFKSNLVGDNDTLSLFRPVITFDYYNQDNVKICESHRIGYDANQHVYKNDDTGWYAIKPVVDNVPIGCSYVKITYELLFRNANSENINCSGDIYIDGILID